MQDMETGAEYQNRIVLPGPHHRGDGALTRTAPPEYAFDIPVMAGRSVYLKLIR